MARDDNTRLRITPWPSVPLPHPDHARGFPYIYDAEADALVANFDTAANSRDLLDADPTTELYLKLAALDPGDVESVVRFVSTYGPLDVLGKYAPYPDRWAFPMQIEAPEIERAVDRAGEVR